MSPDRGFDRADPAHHSTGAKFNIRALGIFSAFDRQPKTVSLVVA